MLSINGGIGLKPPNIFPRGLVVGGFLNTQKQKMEGWIKIHKKLMDWGWYSVGPTKDLFIHILLLCANNEREFQGVNLQPGQCTLGRDKTAEALGITVDQYRTAIEHLKSTNEITTETTNRYTLITVCKWEEYQTENKKSPTKSPSKSPTNPQQIPTKEDIKNNKIYICAKSDVQELFSNEEIQTDRQALNFLWSMIEMGYKSEKDRDKLQDDILWIKSLLKECLPLKESGSLNREEASKIVNSRKEYWKIPPAGKKYPTNFKSSLRTFFTNVKR